MEGSKLIAALADCLKTFSKGFDQIQETARKVAAARAIAINKAIDLAKVEGLKPAQIVTLIDSEVLKPAFDCDVISGPTRYQYRSGIGKALAHNVAWYPKAFELPAIEEPGKKTRGRKAKAATKAVTLGTVKIDRRGRKVEIKLATSTDIDLFAGAVQAVQSEPGRIALFLNYCKASGWFDHEAEAKKRAEKAK